MPLLKSAYERLMEQFVAEGRVVVHSHEESQKIVARLHEGMDEFRLQDKKAQVESACDSRYVILNT